MKCKILPLLEVLDNERGNLLSGYMMQAAGVDPARLPFLTLAGVPEETSCNQCEEMCHGLSVHEEQGNYSIWCEERGYGSLNLDKKHIQQWRLDTKELVRFILFHLECNDFTPLKEGRLYDLGLFHGHTLVLTKGVLWTDAEELLKASNISNPLFITVAKPPAWLKHPAIWLGQLLIDRDGTLALDVERLYGAVPIENRLLAGGAEQESELARLKKGARQGGRNRHAGTNIVKLMVIKPMFLKLHKPSVTVANTAGRILDALNSLFEQDASNQPNFLTKYNISELDHLKQALEYVRKNEDGGQINRWCSQVAKGKL